MGRGGGAETALLQAMAKPAPPSIFACRFPAEETYQIERKIGKGSYGTVVAARDRGSGEPVAIKHIDRVFLDTADAVRTVRELRFLRVLKHPAIVNVRTVLIPERPSSFDDVFIVTELLDSDLSQLIRRRERMSPEQARWLVYQLFEGLEFIHSAHVYHRDLKPANLLVSAPDDAGMRTLKLCDFGLARASFEGAGAGAEPARDSDAEGPVLWTDYVATRWYRAPELICSHGGGNYDGSIDVWAAGCILAELWRGRALFPARNLYHQLDLITAFIGSPTEQLVSQLRNKKARTYLSSLKTREPSDWAKVFAAEKVVGDECECGVDGAFEVLRGLLRFEPVGRMDAKAALRHPFFADCAARRMASPEPPPVEPQELTRKSFAFENKERGLKVAELRAALHSEILLFHSTPASPNFAPISSGQVKAQMKELSLDGGGCTLHGSSSMPGPQMASLAGALSSEEPCPAPAPVTPTQKMCQTSAGPPMMVRKTIANRSRSRSRSPGGRRTRSPRGRGRARSRSPSSRQWRAPSSHYAEITAAAEELCDARSPGKGDMWSNPMPLVFDVGMFGDFVSAGIPVEHLSVPGLSVDSQAGGGNSPVRAPDAGKYSTTPGAKGVLTGWLDRMMSVRTIGYSTGMADEAEWMAASGHISSFG